MALVIYPLSRAELILEVMTVRMSAVDLEARKPYWKSLRRPLFSRWATRSVLMTDSNSLLIMLRRLIGRYCEGSDWSPEFLKTGQTEDSFQQSGKHSSWMHLLNNFARIGESSGDKFFKTTTGILSGPVALDDSSSLILFDTSFAVTQGVTIWFSLTVGKKGTSWPWSSKVEFEAKMDAKMFALSVEEETV